MWNSPSEPPIKPPLLPPRQYDLVSYLWSRQDARLPPPSVREMASALGVKSKATIHKQLEAVRLKGYVERPAKGFWHLDLKIRLDGIKRYARP